MEQKAHKSIYGRWLGTPRIALRNRSDSSAWILDIGLISFDAHYMLYLLLGIFTHLCVCVKAQKPPIYKKTSIYAILGYGVYA